MKDMTLVSVRDICKMTTLATPSIYRLIKEGRFPAGKLITKNRRVWRLCDVQQAIDKLWEEAE